MIIDMIYLSNSELIHMLATDTLASFSFLIPLIKEIHNFDSIIYNTLAPWIPFLNMERLFLLINLEFT